MSIASLQAAGTLAGALESCVEQIRQMKDMFPDDDDAIAQALQDAEDAFASYEQAKAEAKIPVMDLDQLSWEGIKADIANCPRWNAEAAQGLMMNDIVYEIREWIKAGAPLPGALISEELLQSIAEKIQDVGDNNVLDDAVHDVFSEQASATNNAGHRTQIRALLMAGHSEVEILEKIIQSLKP